MFQSKSWLLFRCFLVKYNRGVSRTWRGRDKVRGRARLHMQNMRRLYHQASFMLSIRALF